MQWFSWRTCTVRTAGAGASGGMPSPPREICKTGFSKMQFPAFPEPELGNRNYDRNYLFFFFDCMHDITKWVKYGSSLSLVNKWKKTISHLKKINIPCVNYRTLHVKQPDVGSGVRPETKPLLRYTQFNRFSNRKKGIAYLCYRRVVTAFLSNIQKRINKS